MIFRLVSCGVKVYVWLYPDTLNLNIRWTLIRALGKGCEGIIRVGVM